MDTRWLIKENLVVITMFALAILLLILIAFGISNNLATLGETAIAMATLILCFATFLLAIQSKRLTDMTAKLTKIEMKQHKREKLKKMIDEADKILEIDLNDHSISKSLAMGNIPNPEYNCLKSLAETLDSSDDKDFRTLTMNTLKNFRFDHSKENERVIYARKAEDLYREFQTKLRKMRPIWQQKFSDL